MLDTARAAAWYRIQSALAGEAAARAAQAWNQIDPGRILGSWDPVIPALASVLAGRQVTAASGAQRYVAVTVEDAGLAPAPAGTLNTLALADRQALTVLLRVPAIRALERIGSGQDPPQALAAGQRLVSVIAAQQVRDAARDAVTIAQVSDRTVAGWVRYLVTPSCGRCAVLAGRFYAWSDGFQRHPGCDCQHRPVTRGERAAARASVRESPGAYFGSLSEAGQDRYFGAAQAEAIRGGTPIQKAVNADRGMWRGRYGASRGPGQSRHQVHDVLAQAKGDRGKAVELLHENGYISGPARPVTSGAGRGTPPPRTPLTPGAPGGDDNDRVIRELAAQLDQDFAGAITGMTPGEREAVREWQLTDRTYERIQDVRRGSTIDHEAAEWADMLDNALARGQLTREVVTWRGLRSAEESIGVPAGALGEHLGRRFPAPGFLATSLSRKVAEREFTRPPRRGGPLLLRLGLREGTPAIWVAGAGSPSLRSQYELLLDSRWSIVIRDLEYHKGLLVADAEVVR